MSCEIRSMITAYFFGSSIRMPPIFTNSAVTPSDFMALIFSTNAGGNVFSIPKRIPIFLVTAISYSHSQIFVILSAVSAARSAATHGVEGPYILNVPTAAARHSSRTVRTFGNANNHRLKILFRHPLPQRPIMLAVIPVNIQPMRNALALQNPGHLHIRVQANVPVRRSQHNLHPPAPAQEPLIAQVRQVVPRIVEVAIVVVVAIEEAPDVERSAHGHARRNHIRMPHGKIQRVIAAKTASRQHHLRGPVPPLQIRQKLVDDVALVLHMPPDPRSRMGALVVPTLPVDAVHAEHLDRARFEFPAQRADHPRIFILKKTSHGCRKNEDRLPGVPIHQRLHFAPQFVAVLFVIFAVHVREDCNRPARPLASPSSTLRAVHFGRHHPIHLKVEELSPLEHMSAQASFVAHADLSQDSCRRGVVNEMTSENPVQLRSLESIFHQRPGCFGGIAFPPVRDTNPVAEFSATMVGFDPKSHAAAQRVTLTQNNAQAQATAAREILLRAGDKVPSVGLGIKDAEYAAWS